MATGPATVRRPGHVLVVGNLKGGSGKSTLVMNLACAMAATGRRVAIMDCDPQGTAVGWASRGTAPVRVYAEPLRNLDHAPDWLDRTDWLRAGCDVLVIDLPAVIAPAMAASFLIASVILIPAVPNAVDIDGTRRVLALLETATRERVGWPPRAFLVPVRVREMEAGLEDWRSRLVRLGLPMTGPIRHASEFDMAYTMGSWVGAKFRGSRANQELTLLTDHVLHEINLTLPRPPTPLTQPARPEPLPWWRRALTLAQPWRAAFTG
jgi:chromosome partitioning protein